MMRHFRYQGVIDYEIVEINGQKFYKCPLCGRLFLTKKDAGHHTDYHRMHGFRRERP